MPPELANLFPRLRYRIRRVLMWESLTGLLAALGIGFLIGMAVDWWLEPPPAVRLVALLLAGAAALVWLIRSLVTPLLWRFPDHQLALLVERRCPAYADSLVTTVDLNAKEEASGANNVSSDAGLAQATRDRAAEVLRAEGEPEIVSSKRIARRSLVAGGCLAAIATLAVLHSDALATYARRLALSPEAWPRRVSLTLEGFQQEDDGVWRKRIARGDAVQLLVRADLTGEHLDPGQVWLRTKDEDGLRSRESFARVGNPTTGEGAHQLFRQMLEDVRSNLSLRIHGGDARIEPIQIKLAPRPVVVAAELLVSPPAYLGRPELRTSASALAPLPEGAAVVIHFTTNKPLQQVEASWSGEEAAPPAVQLDSGEKQFSVSVPPLMASRVLRVELTDTDGIVSAEPYPISLNVRPDTPPRVTLRLVGVGSAITPDADIGVAIDVEDDYAIDSADLRLQIDDEADDKASETIALGDSVAGGAKHQVETSVDLLTRRFSAGKDAGRLEPGQRIALTARASDRYDLSKPGKRAGDRTTSSQRYVLEVITASQLLARIEEREINLRRTFEEVLGDMQSVERKLKGGAASSTASPATESSEDERSEDEPRVELGEDPTVRDETLGDELPLREIRLQLARLLDDVQKVSQETGAVGESFRAIHEELIHNRISNQDLLDRVGDNIATPLLELCDGQLQDLGDSLRSDSSPDTATASRLAGVVVKEMEQVLEQMKSLETYNEVLAILRQVIDDQQRVRRATERSRREQVKRMLLE